MRKAACLLLGALLLFGCSQPEGSSTVPGNLIDTADPLDLAGEEPTEKLVPLVPEQQASTDRTWFDLNADGEAELIVGPIGDWTSESIDVRWRDGRSMRPFNTPTEGIQHRVDIVKPPSLDRPFLLHQWLSNGHNYVSVQVVGAEDLQWACCWAFKAFQLDASRVEVSREGVITLFDDNLWGAGYQRMRQYEVGAPDEEGGWYQLKQVGEKITWPERLETPHQVLVGAYAAMWEGRPDKLEEIMPDGQLRERFLAYEYERRYYPGRESIQVGRRITELTGYPAYPWDTVEEAPPDVEGWADFVVTYPGYEMADRYFGRVKFVQRENGDWIINAIQITEHQFHGI